MSDRPLEIAKVDTNISISLNVCNHKWDKLYSRKEEINY